MPGTRIELVRDQDPEGFLIEGFNEPMSIATNCNFPYMNELLEQNGFDKKTDLVVYKIEIPEEIPEWDVVENMPVKYKKGDFEDF